MITAATNTFHETGRNHRTISQDEQGFILHGDEQAQTDQGIERAVGA